MVLLKIERFDGEIGLYEVCMKLVLQVDISFRRKFDLALISNMLNRCYDSSVLQLFKIFHSLRDNASSICKGLQPHNVLCILLPCLTYSVQPRIDIKSCINQ